MIITRAAGAGEGSAAGQWAGEPPGPATPSATPSAFLSSLLTSPYTPRLPSPCALLLKATPLAGAPLLFWNLSLHFLHRSSSLTAWEAFSIAVEWDVPGKASKTHSSLPSSATAFSVHLSGALTLILQFVYFLRHWACLVAAFKDQDCDLFTLCPISLLIPALCLEQAESVIIILKSTHWGFRRAPR